MKLRVLFEGIGDGIKNAEWELYIGKNTEAIGSSFILPIVQHIARTYFISGLIDAVYNRVVGPVLGKEIVSIVAEVDKPKVLVAKAAKYLKNVILNDSFLYSYVDEKHFLDKVPTLHDDDEFGSGTDQRYGVKISGQHGNYQATIYDWRQSGKYRGTEVTDVKIPQDVIDHMGKILDHNKKELVAALETYMQDRRIEL
jgi:hypothetical protein